MATRDWSDLQQDMLELIAKHLPRIEDYVAFGAVCTSWRAASSDKKNFKGIRLWQGIPCLMLRPDGDKNDVHREFYSLMENEFIDRIGLPQIKGKKCLESLGWLLAICDNGDMSLFHPFTGDEIPLPNQNTFPEYDDYEMDTDIFVRRMVLSSSPTEGPDFAVVIICGGVGFLAFWRPGDTSWNRIETRKSAYCDVICYHGRFFAIDHQGNVVVLDLVKGQPNPTTADIITRVCTDLNISELLWYMKIYLVAPQSEESCSSSEKLLVVTRDGSYPNYPDDDDDDEEEEEDDDFPDDEEEDDQEEANDDYPDYPDDEEEDNDDVQLGLIPNNDDDNANHNNDDGIKDQVPLTYGATTFRVFELDLVQHEMKEMKSLGGMAIFLGHSASMSLQVSSSSSSTTSASKNKLAPGILPNRIYFTDDCYEAYYHLPEQGGHDMGVFDLETGSIEPFYQGSPRPDRICLPVWITPHF